MKFGMRKPNLKKSIKARTTGKIKRKAKKAVNPLYSKKGMGYAKKPAKAVKNSVYHKTTFSLFDIFKTSKSKKSIKQNSQTTNKVEVTLEDVDKMNSVQKTELYSTINEQYSNFYNEYYKNMEKAKENYSLFINNNLDMKYFNKILECYNYNLQNEEQKRNLDMMNNKLTDSNDLSKSNYVYEVLAKAYEKLQKYDEAIEVCEKAISYGYTNDGTKNGYKGRIERLEKKKNK